MHYLLNLFLASNCLVFFFLCVFLFLFYFFLMCLLVCIDYINASLLHIFLVVIFLCAYARNTQFCVVTLSVWHLLPFSSLCHQQHIYCIFLSPFFLSSHPFSLFFYHSATSPYTNRYYQHIYQINSTSFFSFFISFIHYMCFDYFLFFFDSLLDENSKDVFLLL